jgi:hypothetical protein
MRDGDGLLVFSMVLLAGGVCLKSCGQGMKIGREAGRCAERWQYQRTVTDTLATVRSGCALPPKARQGVGDAT